MGFDEEQRRYLHSRFGAIAARFEDTFRYVDLDRLNRQTFSYEYASLLRDAGGTFASVMDRIVREYRGVPDGKNTCIADYRDYICDVEAVPHQIAVYLSPDGLKVYPFEELDPARKQRTPRWWLAYNKIKHAESVQLRRGNLENALRALCGVAVVVGRPHILGPGLMPVTCGDVLKSTFMQWTLESAEMDQGRLFPQSRSRRT